MQGLKDPVFIDCLKRSWHGAHLYQEDSRKQRENQNGKPKGTAKGVRFKEQVTSKMLVG